jgi:hypothetical protein
VTIVAKNVGDGSDTVVSGSSAVRRSNHYEPASNTLYVQNQNYKIGISKKFGAAVVEYYNIRSGGGSHSLNLIDSEIGALFQAALFSDASHANGLIPTDGQAHNCAHATVDPFQWNPTQAGSVCPHPENSYTPTSNPATCLGTTLTSGCAPGTITLGATEAGLTTFRVRFRNWYYPEDATIPTSYPHREYDDVFADITYHFTPHFVQIYYHVWRDGPAVVGASPQRGIQFQQLPVLYGTQFSEIRWKDSGTSKTWLFGGAGAQIYSINDPTDSRWVTLVANDSIIGTDPLMVPGNHLTVAYYVEQITGGSCPPRAVQLEFRGADINSPFIQRQAIVQNRVTFQPTLGNDIYFSAVLLPYLNTDPVPDQIFNIGDWVDKPASLGGLLPTLECHQQQ